MNIQEIKKIIKNISFAPSNLDMGWKWQAKESGEGFLIRTSFKRPDTNSGKIGTGYGRWMYVDKNIDARGLVMTAWLCAKLIVDHELMEAFLYKNVRLFDPHKSLEDLAHPHVLGLSGVVNNFDHTGNIKNAKTFSKPAVIA
jgi:hypothetical protein